jgi:uncharacterized protein YbaR (Trm112 family)
MIDKDLLEILVCAACKKPLNPADAQPGEKVDGWLVCTGCGLRFPIREKIPIMLIDEAVPAGKAASK